MAIPRVRWALLLGVFGLLATAFLDAGRDGFDPAGREDPSDDDLLNIPTQHMRAVDGDTLAVGALRIRLDGLASPEEGHPVFAEARRHMGRLLRSGGTADCRLSPGWDAYGRRIGQCAVSLADGTSVDLGRAMIEAGLARSCPGWGNWRYLRHENLRSLALPFPSYCWPG